MNIDPNTTLSDLVAALPSSGTILKWLNISNGLGDARTLERACADAQIPIEEFLNSLDKVDWQQRDGSENLPIPAW